jgi:ABC-type lipoprotein export system ATPase subunit/GNAT superfamily N-acetyltransferase
MATATEELPRGTGRRGGGTVINPWAKEEADIGRLSGPMAAAKPSARLLEVCLRFGLPVGRPACRMAADPGLRLRRGTITLVSGPSGSGKTLLLDETARRWPTSRLVDRVPFPTDVAVVDGVAPTRPLSEALGLLTACGLGEPSLWLRSFDQLSDGERFRARLARAISLCRRDGEPGPLLCDEFGSLLHTRLARAIAFNLRKLVTREGLRLVVATAREDLEEDLEADCTVRLGRPQSEVEPKSPGSGKRAEVFSGGESERRQTGFAGELRIERGTLRDYEVLAAMHYRRREQVGFVSQVYVIRQGAGGELLGVVVYGHPMLELSLRNRVTGGRFIRQGERLNQEMRVLKRLVIHPDVRGCGLGHWLVRRTLPLAGTRFVECLAAMGAVNPVFEKAGMRLVGACRLSRATQEAVDRLRAAGADPLAADFVSQVCRRPAIRQMVAREVFNWYRATTTAGQQRVARQSPTELARTYRQLAGSQPVYFIWGRRAEDWAVIDAAMTEAPVEAPALAS